MRNPILMAIAAVALFFGLSFVPMEAKAQVSCGATSVKATFPGGLVYQRTCNNRSVGGMGSNATDAQTNINNFVGLMPGKSCFANSSYVYQFAGGYRVTFQCNDIYGFVGYISGVGSTVTAAADNMFRFGQLFAAINDVSCWVVNNGDITAFAGGFHVVTTCKQASYGNSPISGIGSTATDAGINARGFAELVASGKRCYKPNAVSLSGGLFHATFSCGSFQVTGSGATVTAAGQDALFLAQIH